MNQDSRGFFTLPQAPEEAGYYTYGTPGGGAAQYAHPQMLSFIFLLENRWSMIDERKIGIGNISLANGVAFPPHAGHRDGLEMDVRALRKDGKNVPVRYTDPKYDREATQKLVDMIWQTGLVKRVYFNDAKLSKVQHRDGHDDHLHVDVIL